jgi:hypothetical protein
MGARFSLAGTSEHIVNKPTERLSSNPILAGQTLREDAANEFKSSLIRWWQDNRID